MISRPRITESSTISRMTSVYNSYVKILCGIATVLFTIGIFIQLLLSKQYTLLIPLLNSTNVSPPANMRNLSFPKGKQNVEGKKEGDDSRWQHAGGVVGLYTENAFVGADNSESIALGCAVTTRNIVKLKEENMAQTLPFLKSLLTGFCKTASSGYEYHFYVAYDATDQFFMKEKFQNIFRIKFKHIVENTCARDISVFLHLVKCNHVGHPAWAQNDAMMEAYLDNMQYYYRVNDDSLFLTKGWSHKFIEALNGFVPPNVGVVGPNHRGGNVDILTYDFVHKTHLEIFGFYYPRLFGAWWADNWITYVYQPNNMKKMKDVVVIHTIEQGTRYNYKDGINITTVKWRVKMDKEILDKYLMTKKKGYIKPRFNGTRVVSMSLYGSDPRYTYGAIRNAQLLPLFFPGWRLRIYVEKDDKNGKKKYDPVPERILKKLRVLRAEIISVDAKIVNIPPMMWRFLVADDMSVDYFIVRDSDSRPSEREVDLVSEWIKSGFTFHCIRDHPNHVSDPVYGGLWGGRPRELRNLLVTPINLLMNGYGADYGKDRFFMSNTIWPRVRASAFCHDSIGCNKFPMSHPIVQKRKALAYVGQVFDAFGEPRQSDLDTLKNTILDGFCNRTR